MVEIKTAWATLCKAAKLNGVRLHDLRHTYASVLASAGLSLPVIGALLGHTQPGTTARYAHLFDNPLRAATERVGAVVAGAARDAAEIMPMRKGG
jgi:integrase